MGDSEENHKNEVKLDQSEAGSSQQQHLQSQEQPSMATRQSNSEVRPSFYYPYYHTSMEHRVVQPVMHPVEATAWTRTHMLTSLPKVASSHQNTSSGQLVTPEHPHRPSNKSIEPVSSQNGPKRKRKRNSGVPQVGEEQGSDASQQSRNRPNRSSVSSRHTVAPIHHAQNHPYPGAPPQVVHSYDPNTQAWYPAQPSYQYHGGVLVAPYNQADPRMSNYVPVLYPSPDHGQPQPRPYAVPYGYQGPIAWQHGAQMPLPTMNHQPPSHYGTPWGSGQGPNGMPVAGSTHNYRYTSGQSTTNSLARPSTSPGEAAAGSKNTGDIDLTMRVKTSKYKGVCFCKQTQKWRARIYTNNKSNHLGLFDDELSAARAYNKKVMEMSEAAKKATADTSTSAPEGTKDDKPKDGSTKDDSAKE